MSNFPGEYINTDTGNWEIDHGGHGSGYQEKLRPATEEEHKIVAALQLIKTIYITQRQ